MAQFTKMAIISSFIKLLNERPLDKITVKDIVEDCGINRNTFYYHFEDIRALLVEILRIEAEKAYSEDGKPENWQDAIIRASSFALDNKKAVYHIYNSVSREDLERYLNLIITDAMGEYIDKLSEGLSVAAEYKKIISDFYRHALVGIILEWISGGMKEDVERFIRVCGILFEDSVYIALKRSADGKVSL